MDNMTQSLISHIQKLETNIESINAEINTLNIRVENLKKDKERLLNVHGSDFKIIIELIEKEYE